MEEDIKIIKKHYVFTTNHVLDDENKRFKQAIENLINKYKEQEQFIDWLVGYILDVDEIGYAECSGCKNDKYVGMYRSENKKCVECRIEYFKKQFQKESKG